MGFLLLMFLGIYVLIIIIEYYFIYGIVNVLIIFLYMLYFDNKSEIGSYYCNIFYILIKLKLKKLCF